MTHTRSLAAALFAPLFAVGVLAAACDSGDSDSGSTGAGGSGTAGSGTAGSGTAGSGTAGSGTAGSGTAGCGTGGSGSTTPECKAYADCAPAKCDAEYKMCLGDGYASGNFGGPCGSYVSCTSKCGGCDQACTKACGSPDTTCQGCLSNTVGQCVTSKCQTELQACAASQQMGTGGSGSSGAACMTLKTCCDKIMDANIKQGCTVTASSANEMACMQAQASYGMFCK